MKIVVTNLRKLLQVNQLFQLSNKDLKFLNKYQKN
ncbi:unnamed protein product [Paramecium sonneborni]|uniref:Uncharacterized protein n=1 Tax=Paramecium sonneborni TaxID=65129 RepID=A0A8S1RNZ9_9CILI|nr:unnamed protein product [Paramecium sonneborni]